LEEEFIALVPQSEDQDRLDLRAERQRLDGSRAVLLLVVGGLVEVGEAFKGDLVGVDPVPPDRATPVYVTTPNPNTAQRRMTIASSNPLVG
jgi:hypothetical protein